MLNTLLGTLSSGVAASTNSYESIASYTGNGTDTTMTFSSIPSTYASLQLRCLSRGVSGASRITMRFNGATTGYTLHRLEADGSTVTASGFASTSFIYIGQSVADSSFSANVMGVSIIDIIDYASTSKNKTVRGFAGFDNNSSGATAFSSGAWLNTSAINSITLGFDGAAFTTSTVFALYGIKGA